ncbi:HAD hydrolase-like protein [Streptomyces sp. NPDC051907]|uniref:HAD family hydrolase n=1 Tax=Streptomyces sp. NPDC051907 TaxID=3155284 RepID=UPI0034353B3C
MLLTSPSRLRELLSRASLVMWDFDGPVCRLFAHRTAPGIAAELREIVHAADPALAARVAGVSDPLEVLLTTYAAHPDDARGLFAAVRKHLAEAETEAAETAVPTDGAEELMAWLRDQGKLLAVASNNCEPAIRAHLALHGLQEYFGDRVVGRPDDPELMKPAPHSLVRLLHATGTAAADSVMIGDSPADAEAARAAGVRFIGYHPRPHKRARLAAAGAEHFAEDLAAMLPQTVNFPSR